MAVEFTLLRIVWIEECQTECRNNNNNTYSETQNEPNINGIIVATKKENKTEQQQSLKEETITPY